MRHLKRFDEEVSWRGLAAGALLVLSTACNQGRVNGKEVSDYSGDMLVKKIEISGGKYNYFHVSGSGKNGERVSFSTNELTFNVRDSIHVDFTKEKAYPLKDKGNISKIDNLR